MPSANLNSTPLAPPRLAPSGRLRPRPLSPEAFAPYGRVVRYGQTVRVNDGLATRCDLRLPPLQHDPDATLCLSLFEIEVRPLPFAIATLERHPHSAQIFLPASPCRALVVVAGATAEGRVAEDTLEAFVTAPGEGILYAPGQWHLGLTSLDHPGRFQMTMWTTSRPDTEIARLANPPTIFPAD